MSNALPPIVSPDPGYELCYECDGDRLCWSCRGSGTRKDGRQCSDCTGRGLCIVCDGEGQLVVGSRAKYAPEREGRPDQSRTAKRVGCFRELGYEDGPSLVEARGKRTSNHRHEVVAYLKAGRLLVMSPGIVRDYFDRGSVAGTRSIRTDGTFAWPDSLAFYVERYAIELPADFEQHMAAQHWHMPHEIDIVGLVPDRIPE